LKNLTSSDFEKIQHSPRHIAQWQKAQQQLLHGRAEPALAAYRELVKQFPGVPGLWFELGMAAAKELDFDLADRAFQRTAELAPNDASMLVLLGQQYHQLRQLDKARASFERAVAADPASVHARLSLADWYERERRLDDAWHCVETCLTRHPDDPQTLCIQALLLHRRGKSSEAESLLRDLIRRDSSDLNVRYSARHQLAMVLNELGQYAEALKWLLEAKAVLRGTANVAKMEAEYDRADRRRRDLLAGLTPETIRRWRQEGPAITAPYRFAFLGGHPRSGTTLLEQILGAHPALAAFDEPVAFVQEVIEPLAPLAGAAALTPARLDKLPATDRARFRRRYLKSLLREEPGEPAAEVLLDKNPSPTSALHLWLRVFPDFKAIIALRDPRDVVVSCFFQNLRLTATNANFLNLERTAKHYGDLMDVWLRLRELGGFDWLESRYEDVVNQTEAEGRRVTEFLGLTWHSRQANHVEFSRKKYVFAPNYNEVAQPVYRRAVGRWQNYAEALAAVQARLAPYCRAFGY